MSTRVAKLPRVHFRNIEYSLLGITQSLIREQLDHVLIRGAGLSLVIRVLGVGLAYGVNLLLARWMGVTAYGQYVYALAWAVPLSAVAGIGLHLVALRYVPEYLARNETGLARGVIRFGLRGMAAATLITLAVVVGSTLAIGPRLHGELRDALLLACLLIPLLALTRFQSRILLAYQRIGLATIESVIRPILLVSGAAAVLAYTGSINAHTAVAALTAALLLVALFQFTAARIRSPFAGASQLSQDDRPLWIATAKAMVFIEIFQATTGKIDIMLLGLASGVDAVAIFGVAKRVAVVVAFVEIAVAMMVTPLITRAHATGDRVALGRLVQMASHWMFWPTVVIGLIVAFFGEPILGMFGNAYVAGQPVLWLLIIAQVLHTLAAPAFIIVTFTGYHREAARLVAAFFAINATLVGLGISYFGMVGAASAAVVSAVIWNILIQRWVWTTLKIPASLVARLVTKRTS